MISVVLTIRLFTVELYVRLKVSFSANCIFLTFERTCVKILLQIVKRFFLRMEENNLTCTLLKTYF